MTRDETSKVLSYIKAAYPSSFKDMAKDDMVRMLSLWERKFKEIPADLVFSAVDALIDHLKFPPSIAEVEEQLTEIYWDNFMDLWAYNSGTLKLTAAEYERGLMVDQVLGKIANPRQSGFELFGSKEREMIGEKNEQVAICRKQV